MSTNLTLEFQQELKHNDSCTLELCDPSISNFRYRPNLAVNIIFLGLFGFSLALNVVQGWRWKTWSFLACMVIGNATEIAGYVGRILGYNDLFSMGPYLMQICCLTMAPVFFAAAIYISFTQIVILFGPEYSRISPKMYYIIFCSCDFISLSLQGAGGGIAASADPGDQKGTDNGSHIMLGGLVFQVITLVIFMGLCAEYTYTFLRRTSNRELPPVLDSLKHSRRFHTLIAALVVATVLIIVRSIFRAVEMAEGWDGELMANETDFIILEGVMVIVAVLALNVGHPGMGFMKAKTHPLDGNVGKDFDSTSEQGVEMLRPEERGTAYA